MNKQVINLYDHFKNTPKKLKIICDWDEVIQACEPYALWEAIGNIEKNNPGYYDEFIDNFWNDKECPIVYSPYGSSLKVEVKESKNVGKPTYVASVAPDLIEKQWEVKNSPDFYQEAPFLTIAEDLLKLIKEDKVDRIIFLSAYDKRKFPNGDERKFRMIHDTFGGLTLKSRGTICSFCEVPFSSSENQGRTKADWIKENASDFDIFIDDNPNICKDVAKVTKELMDKIISDSVLANESKDSIIAKLEKQHLKLITIAPYYPAIEHHPEVVLVKNEVSELKKEDFE